MSFVVSELWPLVAAATWIALGVFITRVAIAGRKRDGAREGAESRWARPRTAHGSGPLFAGPTGISVHRRMSPQCWVGRAPGPFCFSNALWASSQVGPSLGRVS